MSRAGAEESIWRLMEAVEAAAVLMDRGDRNSAAEVLVRAASLAAESGDANGADELSQIAACLVRGERYPRNESVAVWPVQEESSCIRIRPAVLEPANTTHTERAEGASEAPVPYPEPTPGFGSVPPLPPEPTCSPDALPQFSPTRPRYFCRFAPRRREKAPQVSLRPPTPPSWTPLQESGANDSTSTTSATNREIGVPAQGAFAALSREGKQLLRQGARRVILERGQVAPTFALALVMCGHLSVHPVRSGPCAFLVQEGMLVRRAPGASFPIATQWAASDGGVRLLVWEEATASRVLEMSGGLDAALEEGATRAEALVLASLGPLGHSLSESTRAELFNHSDVRALQPGESLVARGDALPGLVVVGAGDLHAAAGESERRWGTADLVEPAAVLLRSKVDRGIVAGDQGATVLVTESRWLHEFLCIRPDMLEMMSSHS